MKTLLQILNDKSVLVGFKDFRDATDNGRVYLIEYIIEESGKEYLNQFLNQYNLI